MPVRKYFFFEKKKQKTFAPVGFGPRHRRTHRVFIGADGQTTSGDQKFFASFFPKK
jgi:hypothetical protein